ncbi:hypothetical protein MNBD_ACTINO01-1622 [hydrothermal vent metagenome]|uniref:Uncharacterized protein n=1 Tax=hydrothermal vent metagenome TaxID=652676 RepID=A0A3B0SIH3_9ZZZZ
MPEDRTDTISLSVRATVGTDVAQYAVGEPPPKLFGYRHTWPFDDPESEILDLTPSQHSKLVRAAFTELLPADLSADERHDAWHRFLVEHPTIWPACHGGLADRVEEAQFFTGWFPQEPRSRLHED